MTTSNDGFHGVAYGKFRKKVLRKMTPYDQPAISITNSNPNNTSKSGFLSRLIYLVTCAFWKRNPEEADRVDPPDTPPEPARTPGGRMVECENLSPQQPSRTRTQESWQLSKAAEAVKRRNEMLKRPNFGLCFAFGNKLSKKISRTGQQCHVFLAGSCQRPTLRHMTRSRKRLASNAVAVIKTRVMNVKVPKGVKPPYKGAVDCAVNTIKAKGHERDARMAIFLAVGPVSRVMWHRGWGASFIVRTIQDVSANDVTPPSP
ncbi:hypothetical protein Tco_1311784 [Tanacetum coccineum]